MSLLNPLNPAAGEVPVPEDPSELAAALRAGAISYRLFPYLEWRYGDRGVRFTRSDSAWLAWLTRHSQEHVDEQIAWLQRVLSNRGMPSWILELHLRILYRKLSRGVPANEQKYACLMRNAERLRAAAETSISAERSRDLVRNFAERSSPGPNPLLENTARLLVSAVADEKLGIKNAVNSLESWLADVPKLREIEGLRQRLAPAERRALDSDEFVPRWQQAIESTIAQARRK